MPYFDQRKADPIGAVKDLKPTVPSYDPFNPTNQNVIEPYARAGTRALGQAATAIGNAAGNAADAVSNFATNQIRSAQINNPNYSLIAPATGPARNRPEGFQNALDFVQSIPQRITDFTNSRSAGFGGTTDAAPAGSGGTTDAAQGGKNFDFSFIKDFFSSDSQDAPAPADPLAVGEGEGVIRSLGSGRTVRGSNADSARLNTFDLKGANKRFAQANEIRRQTIADLGRPTFDPSQVVIAGGGQDDSADRLRSERLRLAKALEDGTGNFQQNFRALQALDNIARTDVSQAGLGADPVALASLGLRQDQFALEQAKFLNADADFKEQQYASTLDAYNDAKAKSDGNLTPELEQYFQTTFRNLAAGVDFLQLDYERRYPQKPEEFANGGLVGAIETYANGGMISPSGPPPMPAIMQQYQQYADGARQMGLTAVPFEQFAALQSSSKDTIQSFEDGGMVSDADVSGKMIVDTDPNAPTDSIPAMIDGQRPAALDSGEFVIPKDVVLYYGTDKLQKMIDKVRNPQGGQGNGGTQTALGI